MVPRHVRGAFFADYVRMIRSRKDVDWTTLLSSEDRAYVGRLIEDDEWYPMAVFERLGLAILAAFGGGEFGCQLARLWGRTKVQQEPERFRELIAERDPREALMRIRIYRNAFFDFDAHELLMVNDEEARMRVSYGMCAQAEEAACWQTLGFIEEIVTRSGAENVDAAVSEKSWTGSPQTVLAFRWSFRPSVLPTIRP